MKFSTILIFILLLQLPTFFTGAFVMIIPIITAGLLCVMYTFPKKRVFSDKGIFNKTVLLFIFLIGISILRTNNESYTTNFIMSKIIAFILFIMGIFGLFSYFAKKYPGYKMMLLFVLVPVFLWSLLNLLLWKFNITIRQNVIIETEVTDAVLLSSFGINVGRVQFPLSGGINNYSSILGAMLTISLIYAFVIKKSKILNLAIITIFLISVLLIDSRVAIILPFLLCGLAYFLYHRKTVNFLKWVPLFIVIGPSILMITLPFIADWDLIVAFSRGESEIMTGNSRFLIWGIAFDEFFNFKPIHLIGYGEFGHFGSGASKLWSFIFNSWENSEMKSPHNSMFSILFDMGYVGLLAYILSMYGFFKRIVATWNIRKNSCILYIGFMIYSIIAGFTESLIGFYSPNFLFLFFLVLTCEFSEMMYIKYFIKTYNK